MNDVDQHWNLQGCALICGLSVLLWVVIIAFGYWVWRWGVTID